MSLTIVVDGGAYVGIFTLLAAKLVGEEGKVIAFEPDRENFENLQKNIQLNNLRNVIVIPKGMWNQNGMLNMESNNNASTFYFNEQSRNICQVPVTTLDETLKHLKINKVNFIKMDIEGAEIEALKRSIQTLKQSNSSLAIATYHIINGEKTAQAVEDLLRLIGYKVKTTYPQHLTTYAYKT